MSLDYVPIMPKPGNDSEQIRVRLTGELKEKWQALLDAKKISQQRAILSMLEFIVGEDSLTQSMIFGQVEIGDRAELSRIVLKRLAKGK